MCKSPWILNLQLVTKRSCANNDGWLGSPRPSFKICLTTAKTCDLKLEEKLSVLSQSIRVLNYD